MEFLFLFKAHQAQSAFSTLDRISSRSGTLETIYKEILRHMIVTFAARPDYDKRQRTIQVLQQCTGMSKAPSAKIKH